MGIGKLLCWGLFLAAFQNTVLGQFKDVVTDDGDHIRLFANKTWEHRARPAVPVTDIDGNMYATVLISNAVWMRENLRTTKFKNGDPIPNVIGRAQWNSTLSPAYAAYNNDSGNIKDFGLLYNWFAASDPRGICPDGWRVPTRQDFLNLVSVEALPPDGKRLSPEYLMATGDIYWSAPRRAKGDPFRFSIVGSGSRGMAGPENDDFVFLRGAAHFYTSEISPQNDPYFFGFYQAYLPTTPTSFSTNIMAYSGNKPSDSRLFGLAVRCLRIETYKPFTNTVKKPL